MGRFTLGVVALGATMCLLAGVASATFQPTVLYQPPLLRALDFQLHDSVENTLVEPNGRFALAVLNGPTPPAIDPESDPGCGLITGGVTCPVAGLERVVVSLGAMNDTGRIDLGRHARRLKQRIIGGAGEDGLTGGRGTQRLLGGPDNDILQGGPGNDVLVGGPGDDTCNGGPGRDVVRSC